MMSNPYIEALGNRDPIPLITATPSRIAASLRGLTAEQINFKPAPDRWSIRELICHLADAEIAWAWRLRMVAQDDHHQIQPWDENAWSPVYDRYTLAHAQSTLESLRAWNVAFITGLSEADKRKPVTHPERGEWTMWTIVQMIAGHDLHHLAKLEARVK